MDQGLLKTQTLITVGVARCSGGDDELSLGHVSVACTFPSDESSLISAPGQRNHQVLSTRVRLDTSTPAESTQVDAQIYKRIPSTVHRSSTLHSSCREGRRLTVVHGKYAVGLGKGAFMRRARGAWAPVVIVCLGLGVGLRYVAAPGTRRYLKVHGQTLVAVGWDGECGRSTLCGT